MRENYDTHFGKFDSPMAAFLFERVMMNGDFGDDEYSDGDGTWGIRYGRRVLEGDSQGFVYYVKFDTELAAEIAFRAAANTLDQLIEEEA